MLMSMTVGKRKHLMDKFIKTYPNYITMTIMRQPDLEILKEMLWSNLSEYLLDHHYHKDPHYYKVLHYPEDHAYLWYLHF